VIYPHEWESQDDPLRWLTQEYTSAMEAMIRAAPEQYLWIHRRWKSQPRKPPIAATEEKRTTKAPRHQEERSEVRG
jgi:KDO2-lipid IV(A) lauroyltransferase